MRFGTTYFLPECMMPCGHFAGFRYRALDMHGQTDRQTFDFLKLISKIKTISTTGKTNLGRVDGYTNHQVKERD